MPMKPTRALEISDLLERLDDQRANLANVVLVEAAHRHGGCADSDAGRDHRRPLVEGDGVAVRRYLDALEPLLGILATPLRLTEVHLHQVGVRTPGEDVEPAVDE